MSGTIGQFDLKIDTSNLRQLAVEMQNAQAAGQGVTTATQAYQAELQKVAAQLQTVTALQNNYRAALDSGNINQITTATNNLAQAFAAQGKAADSAHGSISVLARETRSLIDEALSGRFRQAIGSAFIFVTQGLGVALPAVLGFVAALAIPAAVLLSIYNYNQSIKELGNTLTVTGNLAGVTTAQLEGIAESAAKTSTRTVGAFREVENELIKAGQITGDNLGSALVVVDQTARLTGETFQKAGEQISKALADPEKAVKGLAAATHQITIEEALHIRSLQESGDLVGAQTVLLGAMGKAYSGVTEEQVKHVEQLIAAGNLKGAQELLFKAIQDGASNAANNLGYLARAYQAVLRAGSDLFNAVGQWGSAPSTNQQVNIVASRIQSLQSQVAGKQRAVDQASPGVQRDSAQKELDNLQGRIAALQQIQNGLQKQVEDEGAKALTDQAAAQKNQLQFQNQTTIDKTLTTGDGSEVTKKYQEQITSLRKEQDLLTQSGEQGSDRFKELSKTIDLLTGKIYANRGEVQKAVDAEDRERQIAAASILQRPILRAQLDAENTAREKGITGQEKETYVRAKVQEAIYKQQEALSKKAQTYENEISRVNAAADVLERENAVVLENVKNLSLSEGAYKLAKVEAEAHAAAIGKNVDWEVRYEAALKKRLAAQEESKALNKLVEVASKNQSNLGSQDSSQTLDPYQRRVEKSQTDANKITGPGLDIAKASGDTQKVNDLQQINKLLQEQLLLDSQISLNQKEDANFQKEKDQLVVAQQELANGAKKNEQTVQEIALQQLKNRLIQEGYQTGSQAFEDEYNKQKAVVAELALTNQKLAEQKEWNQTFSQLSKTLADDLGGAFEGLITHANTFDQTIKNLEASILKLLTNALVTKPLEELLGGDKVGGAGGGGIIGSLFSSGGSYLKTLFGGGVNAGIGIAALNSSDAAAAASAGVEQGAWDTAPIIDSTVSGVWEAGGYSSTPRASRVVSSAIFSGAPRYERGGMAGLLPGEIPAILHPGERVLNRQETASFESPPPKSAKGTIHNHYYMNINTPDANSFRASQNQLLTGMQSLASRAAARNG